MNRLDGKVVLVTGGAQGEVVARDLGPEAVACHLDVRSATDWSAAVALAQSRFGHLDVLVNNAAILRRAYLTEYSLEDLRAVIDVNQYGPFLGMQAVVPAMRSCGRGSIINVGSNDALQGLAGVIGYAGTKWALRGMTKVAAQELGELNIRVNSVHTGGMLTNMSKGPPTPGRTLTPDEASERWALQRFPDLYEVANVVLFLASEEATYTTGSDVTCDGGATIGPRYVNA
jgi:3alpha(or 20beta)-hydroxysteroid dehydrogenase